MNDFIKNQISILQNKNFLNPEIELRILLNKTSIIKNEIILSNFNIKQINLVAFKKAFERRISYEPISKIFNEKSFWKHNFFVNTDVLDPRPETELIIEQVLKFFPNKNQKLNILDICTGSGCLAISLAKEYKNSLITATDISLAALEVAKFNSKKLDCESQIEFIHCDIISKNFLYDIVVSNPPYLSTLEYKETSNEIKLYEPKIAFIAGNDGLKFYREILGFLPNILKFDGLTFLEIGNKQAIKIIKLLDNEKIVCEKLLKDIQKHDRLLIIRKINID
tara:strand:+ start:351 stop:1190 length:840 start_codon:yes stop_codon:yes gene_type:complete